MSVLAHADAVLNGTRYFGPATVLLIDDDASRVRVRVDARSEEHALWARMAVAVPHGLSVGDDVLVAGEERDGLYVIGILNATSRVDRVDLGGGARAEVEESSGAKALRVFSRRNELLFEYDAGTEKARITVESGDLEFATSAGDIVFRSANDVRFAGREIDLAARQIARLSVTDAGGRSTAAVSLEPGSLELSSPEMVLTAQRGEFYVQHARYTGEEFLGRIGQVKLIAVKLETAARTVIQKARNAYRTVEQLFQVRTGRMRTLVKGTYHVKSRKTMMKAEQDVKIKGERIHLG